MTRPSRVPAEVTVGSCDRSRVELGWGECLGQAEVEHFDLTLRRDLDVGGFEIAMDDALRVRRIERVGHLAGQPQRLAHRHRPSRDDVGERVAFDELEHQGPNAVSVFDPVERRDMRMIERGEQPRFAIEPRQSIRIERGGGGEDLDRHIAAEPRCRARGRPHPCRLRPAWRGLCTDRALFQSRSTQFHLPCRRHRQSL